MTTETTEALTENFDQFKHDVATVMKAIQSARPVLGDQAAEDAFNALARLTMPKEA